MPHASKDDRPTAAAPTSSSATHRPHPLIEKARSLVPLFKQNGAANEEKRELIAEVIAALDEAKLFGIFTPKAVGGAELGPIDSLEVIETVSSADGSTGWVMFAGAIASGTGGAYLDDKAVDQLFTGGRIPVIAGQGIPNGKAVPDRNGFQLSGAWSYGSGVKHAQYIHTGAVVFEHDAPRLDEYGDPEIRIFVVPRECAKFGDNWDVLGLRATGSIDYTIDRTFVPAEFTHIGNTTEPKRGGALFTLGISGLAALGHAAFALGVGRRILDEIAIVAQTKSGVTGTPRESESFLEAYAKAEAKYRAARALVYETWRDIQATLEHDERPSTRQITLARLALNNATWNVADVALFCYTAGGGISLRSSAIQRYFRDMHAGTQHVTSSAPILRDAGRELAGLAPGKVWGFLTLTDAH